MIVILGTAHSKSTPGKGSPDGKIREYQYSRDLCKRIQQSLSALGITSFIDIPEDEEISLQNRCNIVNRLCTRYGANNCIYVSVHLNAAGSGSSWMSAKGWSVYIYPTASQKSKILATCLYNEAFKRNLKGNRSVPFCKYWTANYYVLKNTKCPAVLTENMFQDNKEDVEFLLRESGKQALVQTHVDGILKYMEAIK